MAAAHTVGQRSRRLLKVNMIRAEAIKASVATYWRYQRQCPVIALEVDSQVHSWMGEPADILVVNNERQLLEIEVKVTLSDLKRDAKKRKHETFRNGRSVTTHFYFAVPREIANKAKPICDDLFPYAGIIGSDGRYDVEIYRPAKALCFKKLDYTKIFRIIRGQSGTVCRLASKIEDLMATEKKLRGELQHYKDMERLRGGNSHAKRLPDEGLQLVQRRELPA